MKALEVCALLNEALQNKAAISELMVVHVPIPVQYAGTGPIECFSDTSGNAWFGVLGLINAILDDRDSARIYMFRGDNGKIEFRVTVKS